MQLSFAQQVALISAASFLDRRLSGDKSVWQP